MTTYRRADKSRRNSDRVDRAAGGPASMPAIADAAEPDGRWLEFVMKIAILALAVLWIYAPVCNPTLPADWLWDDDQLLTANLTVQHRVSPDPAVPSDHIGTLAKLWFNPEGADYFPLSYTALWAQWPFFSMDPRTGGPVQPGGPAVAWPVGYHVTTVLLHLLGALSLWRLLTVMKLPGAWLAAMLFAVHPVCVESVAWVSELKNTLSLPLFLWAAISYIRFDELVAESAAPDDPRATRYYVAAIVLFLLAMFAKTSVVAFPVLILLYAWWKRNTVTTGDLVRAAPFFLISVVLGLITIYYQHGRAIGQETINVPAYVGDGVATYREGTVRIQIRQPATVKIVGKLGETIHSGPIREEADFEAVPGPWRARVRDAERRQDAVQYPDGVISFTRLDEPSRKRVSVHGRDERVIYAGPLQSAADLQAVPEAWRARVARADAGRGRPSLKGILSRFAIAGTSLLFYIATIFWPVHLLPIYTRWDIDLLDLSKGGEATEMLKFLLPIPVLFGVGWWFWQNRATWGRHALFAAGFFLLMVAPVLGFITISYMRITWAADHFIYLPMISVIALVVGGVVAWYERLAAEERSFAVAGAAVLLAVLTMLSHNDAACWVNEDALWTHTLTHNPNAWQAHNRLGAKKFSRGHVENMGAEAALRPEVDVVQTRIGPQTRIQNLGAFYHFSWSTHLRPDLGETHNNLGTAWSARAQGADQQGNKAVAEACMDKAIEQFAEACRVTPHVPAIHVNHANALASAGRFAEAATKYAEILEKEPNNPALINNYGVALYKSGQTEAAIAQFRKALAIAPGLKDAQESLAVALGEKPDPSKQQQQQQQSQQQQASPAAEKPVQPDKSPLPPLDLRPPTSPTLGPSVK